MAADDDVRARVHEQLGERLLDRVGAGVELDAPVQEDDHRVVDAASRADGVDELLGLVRRGESRLRRRRGPRRDQVVVDDLGRRDDPEALPVDDRLVRGEGLRGVGADPDDAVVRRARGS